MSNGDIRVDMKDLHMICVNLEKTYDWIPCEDMWWALKKKRIVESLKNKSL